MLHLQLTTGIQLRKYLLFYPFFLENSVWKSSKKSQFFFHCGIRKLYQIMFESNEHKVSKWDLLNNFSTTWTSLSISFQEEKKGNSLSNPDLFPSATITASAEFSTRFTSTLRFVFHPEKLHWSLMAYDEEAATEVFQGGYRKLWIFFQTLGNTIKEYHLSLKQCLKNCPKKRNLVSCLFTNVA